MNIAAILDLLADWVDNLKYGDEDSEPELSALALLDDPPTPEGAIDMELALSRIIKAATQARAQVRAQLAEMMPGQSYRSADGNYIYKTSPDLRLKVIDPKGFTEWLGSDFIKVVRIDGGAVRKTALEAVARSRGVDPETVYSTFLEKTWSEPRFKAVPVTMAAKWEAELPPGSAGTRH